MAKLTKKAAAQLRDHLREQPTDRLVDLLLAEVERNSELQDQLLLEIAESGGPLDLAQFRRSFSSALRSKSAAGDSRNYPRTSGAWARNVHSSIDSFRSLLAAGQAGAVIELTEYALGRVEKAMSSLDDSSGYISLVVSELEGLHHDACLIVRPDPKALARRLFAFEVDGEWDIFIDSVERYADVLGDNGIDEMRRLAEHRWEDIPALPPGAGYDTTHGRFHLERMMEKLASRSGDVDALVEVMSRDLAHAFDFLQIAEVLADAGRVGEAVEWAERGLAAFTDAPHPDLRLDDFVLGRYLELDRTDDLVRLVWMRFEDNPSASTFGRMRLWTEQVDRWDDLRVDALARLRSDAESAASAPRPARATAQVRWRAAPPPSPYQTLIEVLMRDGEVDEAWTLASEHGCSHSLWMSLAKKREDDHPLDAISVYQRDVEFLIDRKTTGSYKDAAQTIGEIVELLRRSGGDASADAYVADVRHRHKPKTKLLRILSESGL